MLGDGLATALISLPGEMPEYSMVALAPAGNYAVQFHGLTLFLFDHQLKEKRKED